MNGLAIQNKEVVVPGDVLAEGMNFLPSMGTYRKEDKIYAGRLGIVNIDNNIVRIIPLAGRYMPKKNDTVIGKVIDIASAGWRLEINSPYTAMISLKEATTKFIERGEDLSQYFQIGDYVVSKVITVTSQKLIDLTVKGLGLRKVYGGRIIEVNPHKVPRIIGKTGSMVSMIKEATDAKIVVGQNGIVWIDCADPKMELLAVNAIKKIESESHQSGLTDTMKEYLEKNSSRKLN